MAKLFAPGVVDGDLQFGREIDVFTSPDEDSAASAVAVLSVDGQSVSVISEVALAAVVAGLVDLRVGATAPDTVDVPALARILTSAGTIAPSMTGAGAATSSAGAEAPEAVLATSAVAVVQAAPIGTSAPIQP